MSIKAEAGPQFNDEELVTSFINQGRPEILDQLVHRHVAKVRSMIYPMVLNDADADDLTQEVFFRMVRGLSAFEGRAKFSTWLYRIVMNTTHTFLGRKASCKSGNREKVPDGIDQRSDPAERLAMNRELDEAINGALSLLSPKLRAAIVLTAIQGMEVSEAARIEGCSVATVYWRIHQARKILRDRLQNYL